MDISMFYNLESRYVPSAGTHASKDTSIIYNNNFMFINSLKLKTSN